MCRPIGITFRSPSYEKPYRGDRRKEYREQAIGYSSTISGECRHKEYGCNSTVSYAHGNPLPRSNSRTPAVS